MTALHRIFLRLGCLALALTALASCSSIPAGPGGQVTKVNTFRLDPTSRQKYADANPSLHFERISRLHGAVTHAEQMNRAGQYYGIQWKVNDRSQPVTVRFQYRQRNTGFTVKTKEVEVTDIRGHNNTEFGVIGDEFRTDGSVTAWRASIVRGKEELAVAESYLWN